MNCKEFFLLEIEYITFPGRDTGGVTEGALKKQNQQTTSSDHVVYLRNNNYINQCVSLISVKFFANMINGFVTKQTSYIEHSIY